MNKKYQNFDIENLARFEPMTHKISPQKSFKKTSFNSKFTTPFKPQKMTNPSKYKTQNNV
jgi:hypothetical protein